jgi:hypothetical protein
MDRLLQTWEATFRDDEGEAWSVHLYGRSRPGDTWQGWIVFVRQSDGATAATDVETTQPSPEQILHWATGLSSTFFDGAFQRARREHRNQPAASPAPPPLYGATDRTTYLERLTAIERAILRSFSERARTQLPTRLLFDELPHANADVVRALEDLEKQTRYLVRRTEAGNDWVILTEEGLRAAGLDGLPHSHDVMEIERPKASR